MRVHTYSAGSQAAVTHPDVPPGTVLRDLVALADGDRLYMVGNDTEIDADRAAEEAFGDQPGQVIAHHCREIAITVTYAATDKPVTARPSTLVKEVRAKAISEFRLSPAESADLVLRLPGSSEELITTNPIGAYVPKGTCALTLDLVHAIRPQG